jgi:hypothetical protein
MMKYFIALGIFLQLSLSAQSQVNCNAPMSNMEFQQIRRAAIGQSSTFQKLTFVINELKTRCVSTAQLIDLMNLFGEDSERLELAMASYSNVFNKNDIYDVYNSFAYFGTALRLYDAINSKPQTNVAKPQDPSPRPVEIVFPQWNYPSVNAYIGHKNCNTSLAEGDFSVFVKDVVQKTAENERKAAAIQLATNTCLSAGQVMKLASQLQMETSRLELLQVAYAKVYDEGNYDQAIQVFSHIPNQQAFRVWLGQQRKLRQPAPPPCEVTQAQFKGVFDSIALEAFSGDKISLAQKLIPKYNCYTSSMAKSFVSLLPGSADKMKMAKLVFDYTGDKENFFQVVSTEFAFSNDRKALSNFVASKGF